MVTRKYLKNISKYAVLIGVLSFFLIGFLGFSHTSMAMGADGQTSSGNCFMPGMTEALCQMNPLEHIASWQSMFTAVPSQSDVVLLLLALLALALSAISIRSYQSTSPPQAIVLQTLFLYYKRHIPIVHPLQEALRRGVLHPKIF